MNLLEGSVTAKEGGGAVIRLGSQELTLPAEEEVKSRPGLRARNGSKVLVGMRPEDLGDAALETGHPEDQRLKVDVRLVEALGSDLMVHTEFDAQHVGSGDPDAVEEVGSLRSTVARFDPRSRVQVGETISMTVDVSRLHFFDADTHLAILIELGRRRGSTGPSHQRSVDR